MREEILYSDLLVCIVLYKQNLADSTTFATLCRTAGEENLSVLVYDNSPQPQIAGNIKATGTNATFYYHHNGLNSGVAGAYNYSARLAKELNKKMLLFFDQDTCIAEEYFTKMLANINNHGDINLFCPIVISGRKIISPSKYLLGRAFAIKKMQPGVKTAAPFSIINSGLAVNLEEFEKIGGYDTQLQLDFSDHYFFYKFKKSNRQFCVADVLLSHQLSTFTDKKADKVLSRFNIYAAAAKIFSRKTKSFLPLAWAALRGLKLSFQYKKISFLVLSAGLFRK